MTDFWQNLRKDYETLPKEEIHKLVVEFFENYSQPHVYYFASDGLKHGQYRDDVSDDTRRALWEAGEYLTDDEWYAIIDEVLATWRLDFIQGLNHRLYRSTNL